MMLTLAGLARAADELPATPQGRVSDYAHLLSPADHESLEQQLIHYEQGPAPEGKAATQIAVVLLDSLNGDPIDERSLRLAERWKIGSKNDDGVLLVVAVRERKVRIEVGYGLEGRIPDALAAQIIRDFIAPHLHTGDWAGGLHSGVAALHQAITGQPVTGNDPALGAHAPPAQGRSLSDRGGWFGGGGLFFVLILMLIFGRRGRGGGGFLTGMFLSSLFSSRGGGGGGGFSGGGGNFGGGGASGDF